VLTQSAGSTSRRGVPVVGEGRRGTEGHIAYLLRQAGGAVRWALDGALAREGLTSPQFLVLTLLQAYPGISGAELARLTQLTPQTINLVVRKLERDALVGRAPHEAHGRVLRLQVTATGRRRLARCRQLADEVEQRMLALLDARSDPVVRRWLVGVARELGAQAPAAASRKR
jgi:DNA-binding MarR family transcriptional regulator